jgi:2-phosphosulfolactate phosphatase
MEISVSWGFEPVDGLTGCVVILDIFRASNTVIAALGAGAEGVYLLADLDEAKGLMTRNPSWLLWGERGGLKVPGFDGDNSPAHAASLPLKGRTVVLTTSSGTQKISPLKGADRIFFGSFANARALVQTLLEMAPKRVTLLSMGLGAREPAFEDDAAASYLEKALRGEPPDFENIRTALLSCPAAERLRALHQHSDLEFCTRLDTHHVVPVVEFDTHPKAVSL